MTDRFPRGAAGAMFVIFAWVAAIGVMTESETAPYAKRDDSGKATSDIVLLASAVASVAAVGVVLIQATLALLSFVFGSVILATTINLVPGLGSSS